MLSALRSKFCESLFYASLAVVLETTGFLSLLANLSLIIVGNLATSGLGSSIPLADAKALSLTIDNSEFVERFNEQSPLDRCQLKSLLEDILDNHSSVLVIDLDLSPSPSPSSKTHSCQKELDELLDRNHERLILLVPFKTEHPGLKKTKLDWAKQRCTRNVDFGYGDLYQSLGMVTNFFYYPATAATLADLAAARGERTSDRKSYFCENLLQETQDPSSLFDSSPLDKLERRLAQINYPKVARTLLTMNQTDFAVLPSLNEPDLPIFIGADWDSSDQFQTPIGNLPGVSLHAAQYLSIIQPVSHASHLITWLLDILIGIFFGAIIHKGWGYYSNAVKTDAASDRSSTASVVILLLFVAYLSATGIVMTLAWFLHKHFSVVLLPLVMSLFMLIDGFVTGPREALNHSLNNQLESACHTQKEKPSCDARPLMPRWLAVSAYWTRMAVFTSVIGTASWVLISHLTH